MNKRPIDRTKKSNIKCVNCEYWAKENDLENNGKEVTYCVLTGKDKHYWNRCKQFEWAESGDKE